MYLFEKYDYSLFESRFRDYKRYDDFGYHGLKALFSYLDSLAEDTGQPIEVDVISLCCDYSVCTEKELINDYGEDWRDEMTMLVDLEDNSYLFQA